MLAGFIIGFVCGVVLAYALYELGRLEGRRLPVDTIRE